MMRYLLLISLTLLLFTKSIGQYNSKSIISDSLQSKMQAQKQATKEAMQKVNIQQFIIKADNNTYGYMIFIDGNMYIEQKTIPGLAGNLGFASSFLAEKCANLVIKKIKNGEMPPTVNEEEMKKINQL